MGAAFVSVGCFGVTLRETGDGDAKVAGVGFVDVSDEVSGGVEAVGVGCPGGGAVRGVTAEGEDILAAVGFGVLRARVSLIIPSCVMVWLTARAA